MSPARFADSSLEDASLRKVVQHFDVGGPRGRDEAGDGLTSPITDGDRRALGDLSEVGAQSRSELSNTHHGLGRRHVVTLPTSW